MDIVQALSINDRQGVVDPIGEDSSRGCLVSEELFKRVEVCAVALPANSYADKEETVLPQFEIGLIASPAGGGHDAVHVVGSRMFLVEVTLQRVAEKCQRVLAHN